MQPGGAGTKASLATGPCPPGTAGLCRESAGRLLLQFNRPVLPSYTGPIAFCTGVKEERVGTPGKDNGLTDQ